MKDNKYYLNKYFLLKALVDNNSIRKIMLEKYNVDIADLANIFMKEMSEQPSSIDELRKKAKAKSME
jgi:hypothetical protein